MLHPFVLSCFSRGRLFVTLWIVARPAPLSMEFSREQYWSGLPWPSPGNFPNPGIKPTLCLLCLLALVGDFFTTSTTWEDCHNATLSKCQCMLYNISFNFWHFHYDRSWCRSAWDYLVWHPLFFLYLDISSFRFGNFMVITSLYTVWPASSLSSSGTPLRWMWVYFLLSQRSLRLFPCF